MVFASVCDRTPIPASTPGRPAGFAAMVVLGGERREDRCDLGVGLAPLGRWIAVGDDAAAGAGLEAPAAALLHERGRADQHAGIKRALEAGPEHRPEE